MIADLGTSEAKEVLTTLVGGQTQARLTQEARESVERLSKRKI